MSMLSAALLLAVSPQAAPAPAPAPEPEPERALLDAFKAACSRVDDLEAMKADALASGWEEIADADDPRIGRLTRLGREAIGDDGSMSGANFRRELGDRTLFLIASRYVDETGFWGNGCRLYHFEAGQGIDPALLEAWMGRPPTGRQDLGPVGHKSLWEPGWRDGLTVEINHVPQGSAYSQSFGLSGNILVAQAIGGF